MGSLRDFLYSLPTGSELADKWETNRRASDKALEQFVDEHPHLWGVAAFFGTAMDLGAGTVDMLRFGEGIAESQQTGKVGPLFQDVLRGVGAGLSIGGAVRTARPVIGRALKLYRDIDPNGGICVPISITNALRRTGQRLWLSVEEVCKKSNIPFANIWEKGLTDPQMIATLRRLGARFDLVGKAQSFENLSAIARRGDGVVSLPLRDAAGGHMALLERVGGRLRIVDRTGFYNSLEELSKAYKTTWEVDPSAPVIFVKDTTIRLLNKVATLMVEGNALLTQRRKSTPHN